ncbi:MAG: transcription termination/antitermination protein NusA [Acidobacteria bacterium]|nr:transcription termination/antitermination protein NusA [Acidobacteriota bacterium]
MSNPLQQTIEALAKEKGIEPDVIVTAIEDAVLTASRKYYKSTENLRTKFNHETGQVELFSVRQIVEEVTDPLTEISLAEAQELYGDEAEVDMEIEFPKPTDVLGRIAAQTAKQVIFQKVREAERDNVYALYSDRVNEVINGTVKRFENGDIVVDAERVEALLPRREQSRAENYTTGDRIRAVIREVNKNTKGPQIILSRTDPTLLVKMFEQEVPEIYDGTVTIRGAVREAGDRAKVAVHSRERDVDPVGACVGMKGTRVQAIIRELRGEKIDIVEWSDDPVVFVTNAISPARVQRVTVVDSEEPIVEVVVEDRQLSLAIGKKGQNVRLAAKLTGWKIDIKSEEEKRREVEARFDEIEEDEEAGTLTLPGLDDGQLLRLSEAGLDTADRLLEVAAAELAEVAGVDEATAGDLQAAVREQVDAAARAARAPDETDDLSTIDPAGTTPEAPADTPGETPTAE